MSSISINENKEEYSPSRNMMYVPLRPCEQITPEMISLCVHMHIKNTANTSIIILHNVPNPDIATKEHPNEETLPLAKNLQKKIKKTLFQ